MVSRSCAVLYAIVLATWTAALGCTPHFNLKNFTNPCNFYNMLRFFYDSYVPLPLLQISVCVANLHDFNPSYTLLLPDGTNCSGMWGLRSAVLENCPHQQSWPQNPPPYSWGCFNDALQHGDEMATLRFNACKTLWESSNSTNSTDDSRPKQIETDDSHDIVCMNGSDFTVLNLPNHLLQIKVAAFSYEKVINEMK